MSTAGEQFAQWLEQEHPDVYGALHAHAIQTRFSGLEDFEPTLTDIQFDVGDVTELASVTDSVNTGWADLINSIGNAATTSAPNVVTHSSTASTGGVLSTLKSIGSWITSPQGMKSVVGLGTAIIQTQGTIEAGKVQMAVIQSQAQRAQAGLPPAPITYTRDGNGNLIPVYDTGTNSTIPYELESAIAAGRAHAVTLPDGSIGYTMDNSTLNSVLSLSDIPIWAWLLLGGVAIYAFI